MTATVEPTVRRRGVREMFAPGLWLVAGVIVVPMLIGVLATSTWGSEPDAASYVRVAFGVVAGTTIAVSTVLAVFVFAIFRRWGAGAYVRFGIIAAIVCSIALASIDTQAGYLLANLGLG